MNGHRQAAIALHGLDEADRQLVLERLPASDQALLRELLTELRSLGFEAGLAAPAPVSLPGASAQERLQAAGAETMFALLEHEPASLVAQVLSLADWRWSAALLELYAPPRRDAIRAVRPAPGPARQRFLLDALDARLARQPAMAGHAGTDGLLASFRKRVRAWMP